MPAVQYTQGQQSNPATVTTQPATVMYVQPVGPLPDPPQDHLCFSIMVTICCCWPIGIFAILKSVATRDAINRGDREAANSNSQSAKKLAVIALCIGIAFTILSMGLVAFYVYSAISMELDDFD